MSSRHIFDHRFLDRFRYLIIDAIHRDEIPEAWQAMSIAPAFLGNDTVRCPLLVDTQMLPEADRYSLMDRLEEEMQAGHECLASLAIASRASPAAVRRHLIDRIRIDDPTDGQARQFRYFDPGTFMLLPDILGGEGMAWLLGPIQTVAVPWLGEWSAFEGNDAARTPHFDLRECWAALLTLGVVNRVLIRLPAIANHEDWRTKARLTRQHIERARTRYRIAMRDDLVAFALHALQWHPEFDMHPSVQKLLVELASAAPEDELDYRELTGRLDEADWTKIVQDLQEEANRQGARA